MERDRQLRDAVVTMTTKSLVTGSIYSTTPERRYDDTIPYIIYREKTNRAFRTQSVNHLLCLCLAVLTCRRVEPAVVFFYVLLLDSFDEKTLIPLRATLARSLRPTALFTNNNSRLHLNNAAR